jgi:protein transport protein SEC23
VAVAATLLAASVAGQPARALLFVGGAATDGGGAVVGKDLEQAMRSHKVTPKGGRVDCIDTKADQPLSPKLV